MAKQTVRFDHAKPQIWFSPNFWKNHIFVGTEGQKKEAEKVFQRRGRAVSTVLCLTRSELVRLAAEVHRRQAEFERNPRGNFTTEAKYDYWSRGGSMAKDRQRATPANGKFRYAVRRELENFVMCHFEPH